MAKITTAERNRRYAAKHGVSMAEARKHGSGSHGKIIDHEAFAGRTVDTTRSAQAVKRLVDAAAKGGKNVEIKIITKEGEVRKIFSHHGKGRTHEPRSAKYVSKQLGSNAGQAREAMSRQSGYEGDSDGMPGDEVAVDDMAVFQVTVWN